MLLSFDPSSLILDCTFIFLTITVKDTFSVHLVSHKFALINITVFISDFAFTFLSAQRKLTFEFMDTNYFFFAFTMNLVSSDFRMLPFSILNDFLSIYHFCHFSLVKEIVDEYTIVFVSILKLQSTFTMHHISSPEAIVWLALLVSLPPRAMTTSITFSIVHLAQIIVFGRFYFFFDNTNLFSLLWIYLLVFLTPSKTRFEGV